MKKFGSLVLALCLTVAILLPGCGEKSSADAKRDYSAYGFVGVAWEADAHGDTQTLRFLADGGFRYSCSCGSPVDDADLVDYYTYDEASQTFTLHYIEDVPGAITQIQLLHWDADTLELDFNGQRRLFYREGTSRPEEPAYTVDLTKVSPMVLENVGEDVVLAAQTVIEAFLQYETGVNIAVSGNSQRFLNDMAYVIHCTCPLFGAFTDFSEISSYDSVAGAVSWNFTVDAETFQEKLQDFYGVVEEMLACVDQSDSQAMRAMLLYYQLIRGLAYDEGLLGDQYALLSQEEANLRSSPYYTLVEKSGICTNIAQAYMFLCTQADLTCGTVLHTGGSGMHMWNILQIDDGYYYCDPTWDANSSLKYFGMTAQDRATWAGEYSDQEGTMLSANIPGKYDISSDRFQQLRGKLPVEISDVQADKETQTITFYGYEYECSFACQE